MAEIIKLEEKKFGIQTRTKAKALPWLYLAFAGVFLGLNLVGLTQNLGAGILGDATQGAIWNGNLWQSIANGAYLLAQGSAVLGAVVAVPAIYAGVRNIVSYNRLKKAEKYNYEANKVVDGVKFDRELQKTESIINSMLPSSTFGASQIEKALEYRDKYNNTRNIFKKVSYREQYTWREDVIRRSIVKLTDRLAELTKLQNRNWKSYNSKSGLTTLTMDEIASRKKEMRMIQEYLFSILNKVDNKDPFITTVIAQVKKHRVDSVRPGVKMAGINLVPETTNPASIAVANSVNDAIIKGNVKQTVVELYNKADNDINSITAPPTDAVGRAIANHNLLDIQASKDQARLATDDIINNVNISNDMLRRHRVTDQELNEIKDNAGRILNTLKNTLMNARKKKQGINKAYKDAVEKLTAIGLSQESAERLCNEISSKNENASNILTEMENTKGKMSRLEKEAGRILNNMGQRSNRAKKILAKLEQDIVRANGNLTTISGLVADAQSKLTIITNNESQATTLVNSILSKSSKAESLVGDISARKTEADDILAELRNAIPDKNTIIQSLEDALTTKNATLAEIEQAKQDAISALTQIGIDSRKAHSMVNTIEKRTQEAKVVRNKANSYADKTKNTYAKSKAQIDKIIDELKRILSDANATKDEITEAKNTALTQLSEIGLSKDEIKQILVESRLMHAETKKTQEKVSKILENVQKTQKSIDTISNDVVKKYTRFVGKYYSFEEYMEQLESDKSKVEAIINALEEYGNSGKKMTQEMKTTLENAKTALSNIEDYQEKAEEAQKKAEESQRKTKSHEQAVEQIRNRMSQRENSVNQILTNINELYKNLKASKKVETTEIEKAKAELNKQISELTAIINEAKANSVSGVETLQTQLGKAKELMTNIEKAEKLATTSAKTIEQTAKDFVTKYNHFVESFENAKGFYSSIEERIDMIEYDLEKGKNVQDEIKSLQETVSWLERDIKELRQQFKSMDIDTLTGKAQTRLYEIDEKLKAVFTVLNAQNVRLNNLKTFKKQTPEQIEFKAKIKNIQDWARIICWATATHQSTMKKSSLAGATKYIKSQISGPSKKTNGSLTYSEEEIIGRALNRFLGTSIPDVTKISSLEEAKKLLKKIEKAVEEYNNSHISGSGNSGTAI